MFVTSSKPPPRPRLWLFVLVFAGGYALFHSLYFLIPDRMLREQIYHFGIVASAAEVINLVAPAEQVTGKHNRLSSPRAVLEIVRGCDGSGVIFLLVAAILALAAPWTHKGAGVAGAVALIYLLNQLRIIGLYFVAAYRPAWFTPLHTYWVPTLFIMIACAYFAWWSTRATRSSQAGALAP